MTFRSRRRALANGNDHTVLNALLLLVCAVMLSLGAGILGILVFLPVAVVAERVLGQAGLQNYGGDKGQPAGRHSAAMRSH